MLFWLVALILGGERCVLWWLFRFLYPRIKHALRKGLSAGTEEIPIKIKLVSPPLYVFLATAMDRDEGMALVDQAVELAREGILEVGGELLVAQKARPISERDEKKMNTEMKNAQTDLERDGMDEEIEEDDGEGGSSSSSSTAF